MARGLQYGREAGTYTTGDTIMEKSMGVAWRNSQMVMRKMDLLTWAKDMVRVHSNGKVVHFRKATGKIT